MARGFWDWGVGPTFAAPPSFDNIAEAAARGGSPIAIFRTGLVAWVDKFDYGLGGWTTQYSVGTGAVELVATNTAYGPYAAQLIAPAVVGDIADMLISPAHAPSDLIGFTVLAKRITATDGLECMFRVHLGAEQLLAGFRIADSGSIQLATGDFAFADMVPLTSSPLRTIDHWAAVKLIVNRVTKQYVRIETNESRIDITSPALASDSHDETATTDILLRTRHTSTAGTKRINIAGVALTYEEPP